MELLRWNAITWGIRAYTWCNSAYSREKFRVAIQQFLRALAHWVSQHTGPVVVSQPATQCLRPRRWEWPQLLFSASLADKQPYQTTADCFTAKVVRQVWQGLLAEKLEQKRIEVDIKSMLEGTPPGCVCFMAMKSTRGKLSYWIIWIHLWIRFRALQDQSLLANTPTRQGGKRAYHCMSDNEEAVKRQRLRRWCRTFLCK